MRLLLGASVLATATGCGAKHDPYAASLAKGSEHVEFRGTVRGQHVSGSGDFRGDRGTVVTHAGSLTTFEVVVGNRTYVKLPHGWRSTVTPGPNTPAQMFRKRLPATVVDGLVRRIVLGTITYDFSNYGEHVSITVPRVKGAK